MPAPGAVHLAAPLIDCGATEYVIHYDILGLAYWMLARKEEVGATDLDAHGRFAAKSSHAFQHGYLERPLVDEWLGILGQVMQRAWPGVTLKQHQFSMKVSHDVDAPSRYAFRSPARLLRAMAGDVITHGHIGRAFLAPWIRLNSRLALHPADPANTFDWIMDASDRHGLKNAFYFICGRTNPALDADYEIEHPAIRDLLRRIHARGHEIGLHPSYETYQDEAALVAEARRLRAVTAEEGIEQAVWGGRMHYLRWAHPTTLRAWESAVMTYDSTLGYADQPGFRCGTSFDYPAIDPATDAAMNLRIRPLVAMDVTITSEAYLGLGSGDEAFGKLAGLKQTCRDVGGCFSILWHNDNLNTPQDKLVYQKVLDA